MSCSEFLFRILSLRVMTSAFRFCIKFSMVQLRCQIPVAVSCLSRESALIIWHLKFIRYSRIVIFNSPYFMNWQVPSRPHFCRHIYGNHIPWGGCGSSFAQFCLASPWFPFPEINVCLLNGALINWNWNGCSTSLSPPPFPKQPSRISQTSSPESVTVSKKVGSSFNSLVLHPIVPLSRTLFESWSPACRIYIPNGRLWNWEHDGGASWSMIMMMMLSIRRIQSRNLSIYYSVIQWLKEIWK